MSNYPPTPHPLVINSSCLHDRYFQSAFFASLFDLNDASLGTSPSVLLTSWLHLFSPTCLPETPLKKWFPASVDVLIFGTVFFYLSYRVSEIVLWFAASTQSPVWERPLLTGRSVIKLITITWLRQQKRDVALRLDNCNYNLDLMRLLPVYVYLCVWME